MLTLIEDFGILFASFPVRFFLKKVSYIVSGWIGYLYMLDLVFFRGKIKGMDNDFWNFDILH